MSKAIDSIFTILMVDDDPDDRLLVEDAFSECSLAHGLRFAEDGDAVLALLRSGKLRPHLILLDWNMPRKNGAEVLAELKSDSELATIPVIVLTTSSNPADRELALAGGAAGFRTKPVTFEALLELAHEILANYLKSSS